MIADVNLLIAGKRENPHRPKKVNDYLQIAIL